MSDQVGNQNVGFLMTLLKCACQTVPMHINLFSCTPERDIRSFTLGKKLVILPKANIFLLNIGCIRRHVISSLQGRHKTVRITSVVFKKADVHVNAGYLKVKLDLLKRWHPKYARKRI